MLLSIIIPTKNRQYTCVFAVESALLIPDNDFEVIVQDCSDDNSLEEILKIKFGNDVRLKYYHTDSKPSMNDNWSLAISNTNGFFVYGIGDDDAILPSILPVARWMKSNGIEAARPARVTYTWENAHVGSFHNGRLSLPSNFNGKIYKIDLEKEFHDKIKNCGFGYSYNLPNIYHGFLTKKSLNQHKEKVGSYFSGTSLDVYSAFTSFNYIKEVVYVDFPISIWGASANSNSNRTKEESIKYHYKEFKNYIRNDRLPNMYNSSISIAETTIQALKDIEKEDLISSMDFSLVYAKCAVEEPNRFFYYFSQYKTNKNPQNSKLDFFKAFLIFKNSNFKRDLKERLVKLALKISPKTEMFIENLTSKRKPKCKTIKDCLQYVEAFIKENNLEIQFNHDISVAKKQPSVWNH